MITKDLFLTCFLDPLGKYFGESHFPKERNQAFYEMMGGFSETVLRRAVGRILSKYSPRTCPDGDKMLEIIVEISGQVSREKTGDRRKLPYGCEVCKGEGKKVVNNTAYRCSCELGKTLYPHWAAYNQQAQFVEKTWEKEGQIFTETEKVIYRRPKFPGALTDFGIILKDEEEPKQKPRRHEYE